MSAEPHELIQRFRKMERSPAKVAMLEDAVQTADARHDVATAFELRRQLTQVAVSMGFPEKALTAFTWNLAQFDRDPKRLGDPSWVNLLLLLEQYHGMIGCLCEFPQISRNQIDDALADLARRLGTGTRSEYKLRTLVGLLLGRRVEVIAALPRWKSSPRGLVSGCEACDANGWAQAHFFLRQNHRGLQFARQVLEGTKTCASVPRSTYGAVLVPLLRVGLPEEAARWHRLGRLVLDDKPWLIGEHSEHIEYMVLIKDLAGAVKSFDRLLNHALQHHSPLERYDFLRTTVLLFRSLIKAPNVPPRFCLPESFPLFKKEGKYDIAELADWFESEARALAAQFDARSGNRFRTSKLDALQEFENEVQSAARKRKPRQTS